MSVTVNSKLVWNGSQATKEFDKANRQALLKSVILVEGEAKLKVHVRSGRLRQSITRLIDGLRAFVGTVLEYAPFEEFGTRFRSAHPFLRPAFFSSVRQINDFFKKAYKAVKFVK